MRETEKSLYDIRKLLREIRKSLFMRNRPFYRYGGHFEFYCFKQLLWDAHGGGGGGQICMYFAL